MVAVDVNVLFRMRAVFSTPLQPWKPSEGSVGQFEVSRVWWLLLVGVFLLGTARGSIGQEINPSLPDAPVPSRSQSSPSPSLSQDIDISWRKLPKRVLQDQKDIWLFPTQLIRGRYWAPSFVVLGGTAGLIVADPHVMPYFRSHAGKLDDVNDTFDGTITAAEIAIVPVSILAGGYIRHDPYEVQTGLLAGEAFADGAILDLAMKAVTRWNRPSDAQAGKPFNDTFFNSGKSPLSDSSFPSAHAIGAFSVATVIARRYRQHRWVPWAAYGLAVAVSFSRVTTRAHFPSDVFLGAALGYSITRFVVLQH
jgi:membrane-associated phospholipid phosphatase